MRWRHGGLRLGERVLPICIRTAKVCTSKRDLSVLQYSQSWWFGLGHDFCTRDRNSESGSRQSGIARTFSYCQAKIGSHNAVWTVMFRMSFASHRIGYATYRKRYSTWTQCKGTKRMWLNLSWALEVRIQARSLSSSEQRTLDIIQHSNINSVFESHQY